MSTFVVGIELNQSRKVLEPNLGLAPIPGLLAEDPEPLALRNLLGKKHRLFQGREELFRRGYLLAVATAKGRRGLEIELEATGLKPVFVATRTADEAQAKPHPQMLFDLQDELGARTDETVMIGDTPHDLQMAKNADTPRIGVSTGTYGVPELEELQPLTVLKSVAGLIPWLDSAMNQDL